MSNICVRNSLDSSVCSYLFVTFHTGVGHNAALMNTTVLHTRLYAIPALTTASIWGPTMSATPSMDVSDEAMIQLKFIAISI